MTWEFDYLVFPIAKNLVVSVVEAKGEGKEGEEKEGGEGGREEITVEKVCGSPESLENYPKGTLMVCSGMFAAQTQGKGGKETKGGVVVVKLKGVKEGEKLRVRTRFVTHEDKVVEIEDEVVFPKWEGKGEMEREGEKEEKWGKFGGEGVRKGVLICRYVEFMKRFLEDVQESREIATISKNSGLVWTSKSEEKLKKEVGGGGEGRKVRKGEQAGCLREYRGVMLEFLEYFKEESALLDDTELGTWRAKMEQMLPPILEGKDINN